MNLDLLIQSLLGRATCQLGRHSRLTASARIRNILGDRQAIQIGSRSIVRGELLVFAGGGSIRIGDFCYVGEGARLWSAGAISVGDRVLISHGVNIIDNLTHPLSARARHAQYLAIATRGHPVDVALDPKPVTIEDDVLICANAIVLRGVTIGRAAVVGAGSVVTHDVPPLCVVAGNPARVVRELDDA
jgi:acetyltransferase-like isoleucine patch superfamily enzyme